MSRRWDGDGATMGRWWCVERFDEFMIVIAHEMGWPLEHVTYRRLKTVVGRPTVADHDPAVVSALRRALAPDVEVDAVDRMHV